MSRPDPHALLAWYDRHRRRLPWRAEPDETPDPYRVWLSEIMLQQTTVRAVAPLYARFIAAFPTLDALAAAPREDVLRAWAGLGYYARARNLHACAVMVAERHGGRFPADHAALLALPGVGAYTAAAVAAIAFDLPHVPVDGNVERVTARLFRVATPLPAAKPALRALAAELAPTARHGDFAQALMDLGATICAPRAPACGLCPWSEPCAGRAAGDAASYPRKAAKRRVETRRGATFVAIRADGAVLARTRPSQGLLGGMLETPTTPWRVDHEPAGAMTHAPLALDWRAIGVVEHVFTHFRLELAVHLARAPAHSPAPDGARWINASAVAGEAFPTVFRKALALAGAT